MVFKIFFIFLLTASVSTWASTKRDNTANIGDQFDANEVPASEELRVHEFPNKPDHLDKNIIPAESEERQREEEIKPYAGEERYEIYKPKKKE